jgi:hypothetical protein
MINFKHLFSLMVATLILNSVLLVECYSATLYAKSVSLTDVNAAISSANTGDTIVVPTGSATWASKLTITKGIILLGNGIGKTIITNGTSTKTYLIQYVPSDYSLNAPFRISGFSFNLNNNGGGIELGAWGKTAPFTVQTNIRIDNNRFYNAQNSTQHQAFWIYGGMYGVIDSNQIDGVRYPIRNLPQVSGPSYWNSWETTGFRYIPGDEYVMYFEDNTVSNFLTGVITDCNMSGRYAFRYNTIDSSSMSSWPLFDLHGNYGQGWSCFGGEIYGNLVTAGSQGGIFCQQRGGQMIIHHNNITSTSNWSIQAREEYTEADNPETSPDSQDVNKSYYFNIRRNNGSMIDVGEVGLLGGTTSTDIAPGVDYFYPTSSPGVTCGTLASRPATCSVGAGYWATNQSCSDLTGMVGRAPSKPVSGTLYRCSSPNKWTAHYTPYTYPHPLRTGDNVLYKIEVNIGGIAPPDNLKVK